MTNTAAILIPDISGFTKFMTNTELSHGSFAISMLINAIIDAVGDEYEISEIEGDAVLMFKRGTAPSQKEVENTCLKIFNAFHLQRKWMQQHAVCPCKACKEITNLTLKFVAHHGPVGEIKAGRFSKLSGPEVIVAHRLLKNNVPSNEYLLITEKLLQQSNELPENDEMQWAHASEEYSSIGKVAYRFALLHEKRKNTPEPPKPQTDYQTDSTGYFEIPIAVNYQDAYMVIMNIPGRFEWLESLQKVEQDMPNVFVGSIHYCTFDNYKCIVSPLRMKVSDEEISYAESCRIEEKHISLVYEYIFKNTDGKNCLLACRFLNTDNVSLPYEDRIDLLQRLQQAGENLKSYCEKGTFSVAGMPS